MLDQYQNYWKMYDDTMFDQSWEIIVFNTIREIEQYLQDR